MKMKQKPQKPKREKKYTKTVDLSGYSLKQLLDELEDIHPSQVYFGVNYYDYDCANAEAEYTQLEPIEEFNLRMAQYEKKLAEYEIWYKANSKEIEQALVVKKEKKAKQRQEINAARFKDLTKQKNRIEKEIAKLGDIA